VIRKYLEFKYNEEMENNVVDKEQQNDDIELDEIHLDIPWEKVEVNMADIMTFYQNYNIQTYDHEDDEDV